MGTVVIVAGKAAQRRIVQAFRLAGATRPDAARSLAELRLTGDRWVERLERDEVIRMTSPGMYYLDEAVLDEYEQLRRRRAIVVALVAVLAVLAMALWRHAAS